DLTADDFEVLQDGKRQIITNFSYVSSVPKVEKISAPTSTEAKDALMPPPPFMVNEPHRTIAFVYDDIGSSAETVASVRNPIRRFVEDEMLPNDLVAIIRTGGEVGALQQFTNDKRILLRAIKNLRWHTGSRVGLSIFPTVSDVGGSSPSGSVAETVKALKFILLGMREIPGRKSMILLAENLPTEDPASSLPSALITATVPALETTPAARDSDSMFSNYRGIQNLAELAIRSSVVIYGVDIRGLVPYDMMSGGMRISPTTRPVGDQPFGPLAAQRQYLHTSRAGQDYLAQQTGGFVIRNSNTLLKGIIEDQSGYYLLGYRPTETTFNRKFHKISVRVKRSGLTVRTRAGFYGMTDEDTRPEQITNHDRLNIALMSPFGASDIELRLTTLFAATPNTSSQLSSLIHFSGRELEFRKEPDGRHQATLNLAAIVFGDNGKVIEQVTETRSIRVNDKDLDRLLADGLVYQVDVPLRKPGAYQFRVAVRDQGSSKIGTARQFVEIPDLTKGLLTLSGITVASDAPATARAPQNDLRNAAIRRFPLGSNLLFGYTIYNARTEKATNAPTLTARSRILRDGKPVFTGEPQPIDFTSQSDLNRISTGGGLKLATLPVGEY
ncbi:MAG TPA: VWA domain-containing protein, partial [Pyrinomonadaceae bacterium]|nr:VWA domain-containing protein [Pyrinomonadaceae bacterium]